MDVSFGWLLLCSGRQLVSHCLHEVLDNAGLGCVVRHPRLGITSDDEVPSIGLNQVRRMFGLDVTAGRSTITVEYSLR